MQRKKLPPLGLITNPAFSTALGACTSADNVEARHPGKLESRRGHELQTGVVSGTPIVKVLNAGGTLLATFGDGSLRQWTGSAWTTLAASGYGDISIVAVWSSGGHVGFVFANGVATFLTNTGLMEWDGTTLGDAGVRRGTSFDRTGPTAVLVTSGGFLTDQYQVAYRGMFGIRDALDIVRLSAPTSRTIIANATWTSGWVTTESKNVTLRLLLPSGLTTSHFFQIYRSKQVPVGTQPDDDLQLVYEDYLTTKNISDGYVEMVDTYSDALPKGAYIHTSPNFANKIGDIDGENGPPPAAICGCVFKNRLFLFNILGYATKLITILGVGGSSGIQNNDSYYTGSRTYTAVTGTPSSGQFKIITSGSAPQNIEQTALNLVECINKDTSRDCYAFYASGPDDIPGKIILIGTLPNALRFEWSAMIATTRTCWDPVLFSYLTITGHSFTLTRSGTTVTATVDSGTHNIRAGEKVHVIASGSFATGDYTVLTVTSTTFTYTQGSGAAGPTVATDVSIIAPDSVRYSIYDFAPNGFAYSKVREFGAFPVRNRGSVGDHSINVGAVSHLRGSIVIWSYQGLFRLTGDDPETFQVTLIDSTARLVAPETVVVLDDVAIGWTTKGVVEVSDSGWRVLSDDITPTLESLRVSALRVLGSSLSDEAFGVARESERIYELWVPGVVTPLPAIYAPSNIVDTGGCAAAYVYSYATQRWTTKTVPYNFTHAVYFREVDFAYYGDAYSDDSHGLLYKQRKALSAGDYQDDQPNPGTFTSGTPVGISRSIVYAPFAGQDPGAAKNWQELEALFESTPPNVSGTPSTLTVYASSDISTDAGTSVTPADLTPLVRWWPTLDYGGGTPRLIIGITAAVIATGFDFLGVVVYWEEFGSGTVR